MKSEQAFWLCVCFSMPLPWVSRYTGLARDRLLGDESARCRVHGSVAGLSRTDNRSPLHQAGSVALLRMRAVFQLPAHHGRAGCAGALTRSPQAMSLAGVHSRCVRCDAGMWSGWVVKPPLIAP